MPRNNMPAGWDPPAPAWQSAWQDHDDPLVSDYFGIQANSSELLDAWALPAFSGMHAPLAVERGAWGATEQTFGLGYATDVHAFEQWAKSHASHLAIFDGFLQIVETFGHSLSLRLWHEVTALPNDGCEFEHIACHSDTGLLGYA